jgi:hypothetical protein
VPSWCAPTTAGRIPRSLARPLSLPTVEVDNTCPADRGARYANHQFAGIVLGHGPVRPLIVPDDDGVRAALRGTLLLRRGPGGWYHLKTLWFAMPRYQGPVLIRGRRLDGSGPVVFGESPALVDPQLPPGATVNGENGYREWPGATWLRSGGCFVWQVDGTRFSYTIVFKAVAQPR